MQAHDLPTVREAMTRDVVTVGRNTQAAAAARLLRTLGFTVLPVIDEDGRLLGVVTAQEQDRGEVVSSARATTDDTNGAGPTWYPDARAVGEVMHAPTSTVSPDLNLIALVTEMFDTGTRTLPVVEHGRLVGIVTRGDVIRRASAPVRAAPPSPTAAQAAPRLRQAALPRQHLTTDEQLQRLKRVTDLELAHLDLDEFLAELLDRVRGLLAADTAAVLLYDQRSDELIATAAAGLEEEVTQGVRIPLGKGFAGQIAAQRHAVALEHVDHTTVLNPLLVDKGIRSLLGVPLLAGSDVVGVLHVGTLTARQFTRDDAELLQFVGNQAALAVRAQLSTVERAAASVLQRSLLPARLPNLPGIEHATRYVPAGGTPVRGDWYDVFPLSSGRWAVVIADVAAGGGNGLASAMVMGRLRGVLQAYALDDQGPQETLSRLDRFVTQAQPQLQVTATIAYGVLEPALDRLHLSLAGHLPPVLAAPDQPTRVLDLPTDPPIGAHRDGSPRRVTEIALPPGALLCLYTDGLIKRRAATTDQRLEQLRATVRAGPAETVCATVMAQLVGAEPASDDIAVLLLHKA
jgi:phosphoserine phosphatase RsbU/P